MSGGTRGAIGPAVPGTEALLGLQGAPQRARTPRSGGTRPGRRRRERQDRAGQGREIPAGSGREVPPGTPERRELPPWKNAKFPLGPASSLPSDAPSGRPEPLRPPCQRRRRRAGPDPSVGL